MLTTTYLTNRIASQSLDKLSPLQLLSTAIPQIKIVNDLVKEYLGVNVMYISTEIRQTNYHLELLNVYLWDIQIHKKDVLLLW